MTARIAYLCARRSRLARLRWIGGWPRERETLLEILWEGWWSRGHYELDRRVRGICDADQYYS